MEVAGSNSGKDAVGGHQNHSNWLLAQYVLLPA
jgi:hypothetical protein